MSARVRVIGVGQMHRGDDAVGLEAIEHLRVQAPEGVEVQRGAADGAALLSQIEGQAFAILIDCARGGGAPGEILHLDAASASQHASSGGTSSHGNALGEALALAHALDCLPARLSIYAIVGGTFAVGDTLSPAVRAAVPQLVAYVIEEAGRTEPDRSGIRTSSLFSYCAEHPDAALEDHDHRGAHHDQ